MKPFGVERRTPSSYRKEERDGKQRSIYRCRNGSAASDGALRAAPRSTTGAVSGRLLLVGPFVSRLAHRRHADLLSFLSSRKSLSHPSWWLQSGRLQRGSLVKPITTRWPSARGSAQTRSPRFPIFLSSGGRRCVLTIYSQCIL